MTDDDRNTLNVLSLILRDHDFQGTVSITWAESQLARLRDAITNAEDDNDAITRCTKTLYEIANDLLLVDAATNAKRDHLNTRLIGVSPDEPHARWAEA